MRPFILQLFDLIVLEYIPVGLVGVLVGFTFSSQGISATTPLILAVFCVAFVISGYNSYNAIADKEVDRINKPNRPLANSTMKDHHALAAATFFFVLALVVGYAINLEFFYVILLAVILSILYSFPRIHLKRRYIFGTFTAAILYTILFPLAGWAIDPKNPLPVLLIAYLFILGISIAMLKDFEDVDGDLRYHIKTPLIMLGYKRTVQIMAIILLLSVVVLIALIFTARIAFYYLPVAVLTIPALLNLNYLYETRTVREGKEAFIRGLSILMLVEILFIVLVVIK